MGKPMHILYYKCTYGAINERRISMKNQKPETRKANETKTTKTTKREEVNIMTNKTKKTTNTVVSTGNTVLDNAIAHLGKNPEKTQYKKITENIPVV